MRAEWAMGGMRGGVVVRACAGAWAGFVRSATATSRMGGLEYERSAPWHAGGAADNVRRATRVGSISTSGRTGA